MYPEKTTVLKDVNRTWKQARGTLMDGWMDKQDMVHIYNGILHSHEKNEFESVLVRWTNTESVIQSEVSQRKINIVY